MKMHTPGPWYRLGSSVMYNTSDGTDSRQNQLAEVYTSRGEIDAQLICLAPQMLTVMKLIDTAGMANDDVLAIIKFIIAKAEGRV